MLIRMFKCVLCVYNVSNCLKTFKEKIFDLYIITSGKMNIFTYAAALFILIHIAVASKMHKLFKNPVEHGKQNVSKY